MRQRNTFIVLRSGLVEPYEGSSPTRGGNSNSPIGCDECYVESIVVRRCGPRRGYQGLATEAVRLPLLPKICLSYTNKAPV